MLNNTKSKEKFTKVECQNNQWNSQNEQLNGGDIERKNLQIKEIRQVIEKK